MKHFKTPRDAEKQYFPPAEPSPVQPPTTSDVQAQMVQPPSTSDAQVQTECSQNEHTTGTQTEPTDIGQLIGCVFKDLPAGAQCEVVSKLFSEYAFASRTISVPDDFPRLSVNTMAHLKQSGHSNVLYNLAKGIGMLREDGSDSRFPTKRMPMGLLEHSANFFVADQMRKVRFVDSCFNMVICWIAKIYRDPHFKFP